jgi:hypothetical protein
LRLADLLRTLPQFADPSRHPLEIYQQAQEDLKLVRTSLEALGPSSMTQALIAHVNLELVNARIGILSVDSSLARPASGDPSFPGDLARWLYAQLPEQCTTEAAHVHLRDEFHDGQWDEKIVTAAVKLKLATAQVISPEDELELQLSNLQLAVQWSRWLMCTRGKASDHHLSQAAQEAFADCLWLSGQQEASLVVYDQIVADAVAWSEKYSLRSDALQTLARARRKAAQRFKEIGDIARAEQLRKLAEEDMTRALSLLRLPDGNLDLAGR